MAVQVDEPGRDDKAGRINLPPGGAKVGADSGDDAVFHGDVANLVKAGFRVDHPSITDQQVMGH